MISEVYTAFRRAGVSEGDAKAVAEALVAESLATKDDMKKIREGGVGNQMDGRFSNCC